MTTLDMEVALIKSFNPRQNIIVPNVSWGMHDTHYRQLHECDIIVLSMSNYATEIEIKISKADLIKDRSKLHGHRHDLIRRLYYAVPSKLEAIALTCIPESAGLIVVSMQTSTNYKWYAGEGHEEYKVEYASVDVVRECKINTTAIKWTEAQKYQLARLGTMRILGLKEKVQLLQKKIITAKVLIK
jgi:hypothetical protein